jgi:hypothetical protein
VPLVQEPPSTHRRISYAAAAPPPGGSEGAVHRSVIEDEVESTTASVDIAAGGWPSAPAAVSASNSFERSDQFPAASRLRIWKWYRVAEVSPETTIVCAVPGAPGAGRLDTVLPDAQDPPSVHRFISYAAAAPPPGASAGEIQRSVRLVCVESVAPRLVTAEGGAASGGIATVRAIASFERLDQFAAASRLRISK